MILRKKLILLPTLAFMVFTSACSKADSNINNTINFMDYKFIYYNDGEGKLCLKKKNEEVLKLEDISFKEDGLDAIKENDQLKDVVEKIGFPRFIGNSDTNTLDFGVRDNDIYRLYFSNDGLYKKRELLVYDIKAFLDPNKVRLPSKSDVKKIKLEMSLDEVSFLIGKPQYESIERDSIILNFKIADNSILMTWWNSKYNHENPRNGPYHLTRMDYQK